MSDEDLIVERPKPIGPRVPYGSGWRKAEERYGDVTWNHRKGTWAVSSYDGTEWNVTTEVANEGFVRRVFGMKKAARTEFDGHVLLTLARRIRK